MKLAKVKVEYSCGTTITDRVSLDPATGQVHLPPRLQTLLHVMDESECSPSFLVEYNGFTLPVTAAPHGTYSVSIPEEPTKGLKRILNTIAYPSKDQRQQNARYLHTLSAASIVGFVGFVHAATTADMATIAGAASLAVVGVVLWYQGFSAMKGD